VAAVSDDVAAECRAVLAVDPARLVVVPNGRDPAVFHPDPDAPARPVPVVVFVGRLVPAKRPDRFIALVAALRERGLDLDAVIVGDGPSRPDLVAPAAAAGVALAGPSDHVAEALRAADLLVMPSLSAGEGMPGVLIEAGLSALAVIATAVAGTSTVVDPGRSGEVVPIDDFDLLVSATASLVAEPSRRRAMGHAARERCVERFTMAASAGAWEAVLDGVLAEYPSWKNYFDVILTGALKPSWFSDKRPMPPKSSCVLPWISVGRPAMSGLKRSTRRSSIGSTLYFVASMRKRR
jgi:glycosyltransferase involved in cell wall biosynthesis